jgi:hypothetical protein
LSVNDMEGGAPTASILQRLAAVILAGHRPDSGDGFRLNDQDG